MAFFRGDIFSTELQMTTSIHVYIPDGANNSRLKVLYLLHGLSDNCSNWFQLTGVARYAREHNLAVITPEVQRGFYTNMESGIRYFSYVADELPKMMHEMFGLPLTREKNFVAGLSMGGYGALKCALTYPNRYAGCGAFSSACDVAFNIDKRYISSQMAGELKAIFGADLKVKECDDLFRLAEKAAKSETKPKILMTCGISDSLLDQNHRLRDHIEKLSFPDFRYEEWEGDHTWDFWDQSIQLFFDYLFGKCKSPKKK